MKKFLALSFALALTFSTTVCAAETVVPEKEYSRFDTLSNGAEKSLPEYTSNAVSEMDGVRDQAKIASGSDMVLEKDIVFYSTCEHHLLPFYGKAHIGYLPDGRVAGLSKLARTVDVFARRPQIQEKMTVQIARALEENLKPKGVIVMLEAEHTCMTMRGIKKPGSTTVTMTSLGLFREHKELQDRFLAMVRQ